MPQEPKDLNKELAAKAPANIDLNEMRSQIVQSVMAQLLRAGVAQAAGYTQSEGKNYGSYTRDGSSVLKQAGVDPGLAGGKAQIKSGGD